MNVYVNVLVSIAEALCMCVCACRLCVCACVHAHMRSRKWVSQMEVWSVGCSVSEGLTACVAFHLSNVNHKFLKES